jgi:hypothetical protein
LQLRAAQRLADGPFRLPYLSIRKASWDALPATPSGHVNTRALR